MPGATLIRLGGWIFVGGLAATLVTLIPLFAGRRPLPVAFYLVSMLSGVGLGLALTGVLRSARARGRRARLRAGPAQR